VVEKQQTGLGGVLSEFEGLSNQEALKLLQCYSKSLPPFPLEARSMGNRVMGCTTQVHPLMQPSKVGREGAHAGTMNNVIFLSSG